MPGTLHNRQTILSLGGFDHFRPQDVALKAAAHAVKEGRLQRAVEFLEQGRNVVMSQLGGYRWSLEELRKTNEPLADDFERLSSNLEKHVLRGDFDLVEFRGDDAVTTSVIYREAQFKASTVEIIPLESIVAVVGRVKFRGDHWGIV